MDQKEKAQDPVCGMEIELGQAVAQLEYLGKTVYFCSAGCRQAFDKEPRRYFGIDKDDIREPVSSKNIISLIYRLGQILWVMGRELWTFRNFSRLLPEFRSANLHNPQKFAQSLIDLGPTFVKLGQILSTRPDLLPDEYIHALTVLHEKVPPFAFADVAGLIKDAFGQEIEQLFQSFEKTPVASASLSQVHFALLPDGNEVAVKVQRPQVRKLINQDMIVLSWLVRFLGMLFPRRMKQLNLVDGFNEFKRYTFHELDFSLEGATLDRFRENFSTWDDVIFPSVHWAYTAPTILTMSRVSGLRLGEVLEAMPEKARQRLNRRIIEVEMKMFISDGFFHADMHPGNIFFGQDGQIVLLDVGMVGELTESQRDHFLLYMLAVAQKQPRRAFYHLTKQTQRLERADEEGFYQVFKSLADKFFSSTLSQMSLAQVYLGVITNGSKYGFVFPSDLLLHAKAITTAESLAFTLMPDLKFDEAIRPIISREFFQRAFDVQRLRRKVEQILPEFLMYGEVPPENVQYDYRDDVSTNFLWGTATKALSAKLNEYEQASGLLKAMVNPYAWKVLSRHYSDAEVQEILDRVWLRYLDMEPSIPFQKTFGVRFTVHAAALMIALYEVLQSVGQVKDDAIRLIYEIGWEVYTIMGDLPWFIGGTFTQDGQKRLKIATDAFRSFPFGSPAYLWQDVDTGDDDVIAFDCLRCPVADYFALHNLSELGARTFCKLDIPLAKQWGASLVRTGTLATGASCCDFRWRKLPKGAASGDGLDVITLLEQSLEPDN